MARLEWTDDLDTGIDVIDGQHRRIVEFINNLQEARLAGNQAVIGEVIEGMVDYTLSHFAFEETLMEDAGYPFLRAHRKVHELFVRRVAEFQKRFKAGEDVSEALFNLLVRWLFNHIRNDDAGYVASVQSRLQGAEPEKRRSGWFARTLGRLFGRA